MRPSTVLRVLLGGDSPRPRPASSPTPINRTPVLVEAAPRRITRVSGVTLELWRLRVSGSAPAVTRASITSTEALRTRLHSECSGVSPSLFLRLGSAPRCSKVFTTAAALLEVHTWMALCNTLLPAWSTAFTSAPSCAKVSIAATRSFSEPWKCRPLTARCRGNTLRDSSRQNSERKSSPLERTTARMPCTSPSRIAAISWSVGEERRLGDDQGRDWRPPKRLRRAPSRSSTSSSLPLFAAWPNKCKGVLGKGSTGAARAAGNSKVYWSGCSWLQDSGNWRISIKKRSCRS
mmetsp:Transcript_38043/g.65687  ORF Transcript_38043/g.65687 Transcript_38043/m.65687 type:complete len:291 (-) Transcript_38043:387-1259(-)